MISCASMSCNERYAARPFACSLHSCSSVLRRSTTFDSTATMLVSRSSVHVSSLTAHASSGGVTRVGASIGVFRPIDATCTVASTRLFGPRFVVGFFIFMLHAETRNIRCVVRVVLPDCLWVLRTALLRALPSPPSKGSYHVCNLMSSGARRNCIACIPHKQGGMGTR